MEVIQYEIELKLILREWITGQGPQIQRGKAKNKRVKHKKILVHERQN